MQDHICNIKWIVILILITSSVLFLGCMGVITEEVETHNKIKGMVFLKGGCFDMGDTFGDGGVDEKPVHEVCLDDYYMDKYEVIQKEYKKIMEENPSHFKGDNHPVEQVIWDEANKYCKKAGKRLPTEAEWEYATRRGGDKEKWAGTNSESELGEYAWYWKNSGDKTHPVGQRKPNGSGIYDMNGNVWEWVSDWYYNNYYKKSPKNNPKGPDSGKMRVLRGGSWGDGLRQISTVGRYRLYPVARDFSVGFRCALTP
jgi:formylglycine-generating enzyme required for sulfatase activity